MTTRSTTPSRFWRTAALSVTVLALGWVGAGRMAAASPPAIPVGKAAGTTPVPTITGLWIVGRDTNPTFIVFGSGFGSRPQADPAQSPDGQQGCPATPRAGAGFLYGTNLFANDLNAQRGSFVNQQWDAGIFTPGDNGEFDCVGLVIRTWTDRVVVFDYGNLYDKNIPDNFYLLTNGDPVQVGVKGATFTTTVHGLVTVGGPTTTTTAPSTTTTTAPANAPRITSVTTTGTVAAPLITVIGKGFGSVPPPLPVSDVSTIQGCPTISSGGAPGFDYGSNLYVTDLKAAVGSSMWTAGQYTTTGEAQADCVGLVIVSWSDTQITFTYGNVYDHNIPANHYVLTNGDPLKVVVKGATFTTTVAGLS